MDKAPETYWGQLGLSLLLIPTLFMVFVGLAGVIVMIAFVVLMASVIAPFALFISAISGNKPIRTTKDGKWEIKV